MYTVIVSACLSIDLLIRYKIKRRPEASGVEPQHPNLSRVLSRVRIQLRVSCTKEVVMVVVVT